jgi:DNA ligase (NAD+)
VRYEGEAKHYCPNASHCRPQIIGRIIHFIRRKAMNIEGLGEETIELLFNNSLVGNIADLYDLKAHQIAILPRLGDKSAENIMQSIAASRNVPLHRVIFSLGIRFVGETTAKYLAAHFKSMDALMAATREELLQTEEVGEKIADSIAEYFADEQNVAIIERLREAGLRFEAEQREQTSNVLSGMNIVISGSFADHSRDELKALIEAHGGKNQSAVASNTTYLLAGEKIGPSKLQKATKLGVKIISEQEFISLIGGETTTTQQPTEEEKSLPKDTTPVQGSLF